MSTLKLYHNTSNDNALKIYKEGIIPGLRKDVYGKGSEAEGSGIWCSTVRGYGYGGATITFEINDKDEELFKQNDTEYMIYRTITPEEIIDIDLAVINLPTVSGHSITVESDIPKAIQKFGKDKLLNVFKKQENKFIKPYNYNTFTHLLETGERYLKGNIKLTESKKLQEVSRNELLVKAKGETITRYNKAAGYKGFTIKDIDTNNLLKDNTLLIICKVGKYDDSLLLEDVLYWIQIVAEENKERQINTKGITKAIQNAIDGMDIKVDCTCR